MFGNDKDRMWSAFGLRVRGAAHIRKNKPCQDAFLIKKMDNVGLLCSIADGHGSEKCKYSDEGAEIAVEVAEAVIRAIIRTNRKKSLHSVFRELKNFTLPKEVDRLWKEKVKKRHQSKEREEVSGDKELYKLYGTTLGLLFITEEIIFSMQIGDGDMLMVFEEGDTSWLITKEEQLGVETFSLSMQESWKYFRSTLIAIEKDIKLPELFLLSTDGYANSFISSEDFLHIGKDYLALLKNEGQEFIKEHLEEWLNEASHVGSGDDITFVLVHRL